MSGMIANESEKSHSQRTDEDYGSIDTIHDQVTISDAQQRPENTKKRTTEIVDEAKLRETPDPITDAQEKEEGMRQPKAQDVEICGGRCSK